jgi:hypothetical protein
VRSALDGTGALGVTGAARGAAGATDTRDMPGGGDKALQRKQQKTMEWWAGFKKNIAAQVAAGATGGGGKRA